MPSPVVARRMVDLNISLDDFISMFADQRDVEVHAGMLAGLMQTLVSWEHDDFDWPKHVSRVLGALDDEDEDRFKIFLEVLQEQYNTVAQDVLIKKLKIALADAVRRPMGIIPDSAQGLLLPDEVEEAEKRRPRHS